MSEDVMDPSKDMVSIRVKQPKGFTAGELRRLLENVPEGLEDARVRVRRSWRGWLREITVVAGADEGPEGDQ